MGRARGQSRCTIYERPDSYSLTPCSPSRCRIPALSHLHMHTHTTPHTLLPSSTHHRHGGVSASASAASSDGSTSSELLHPTPHIKPGTTPSCTSPSPSRCPRSAAPPPPRLSPRTSSDWRSSRGPRGRSTGWWTRCLQTRRRNMTDSPVARMCSLRRAGPSVCILRARFRVVTMAYHARLWARLPWALRARLDTRRCPVNRGRQSPTCRVTLASHGWRLQTAEARRTWHRRAYTPSYSTGADFTVNRPCRHTQRI